MVNPDTSTFDIPGKNYDDPNKYFHGIESHRWIITMQKLNEEDNLTKHDIQAIATGYNTNRGYNEYAEKGDRDRALDIAAATIVGYGTEIKNQLHENDTQKQSEQKASEGNVQADQDVPENNTTADIVKISGGTIAKVIKKINEMVSDKSGDDLTKAADNFSALFEVLGSEIISEKFNEVMKQLTEDPILTKEIIDVLGEREGGKIFKKAVEKNFSPDEQKEVSSVTAEQLSARKIENSQANSARKNNASRSP